jgi:hypothetical protein
MLRSLPRAERKGELGRPFSEGWTYLSAWLVAVAGVCSVMGLMHPRERQRRRRRSYRGWDTRDTNYGRRRHSQAAAGSAEAAWVSSWVRSEGAGDASRQRLAKGKGVQG